MPPFPWVAVSFAAAAVGASAVPLAAQSQTVVPAVCRGLRGDAAISLPLRWSHGTLQVFVDPPLLPVALAGEVLTGLRLRRAAIDDVGTYPPVTRTLTVRGGFGQTLAAQINGALPQNRPASTQVLFGPAAVTSLAAAPPGAASTVGDDLLVVPFTTPLPMAAGTLFLEFEVSDAPLQISEQHWVDAVWFENGVDQGYVARVGDGSCTTAGDPLELVWTATTGPLAGAQANLEVRNVPPAGGANTGATAIWIGIDPETRPASVDYLGYGADLAALDPALAGCRQWAPIDVFWGGLAASSGTFATSFALPGNVAIGQRFGIQAVFLDPLRPGLPVSISNGLVVVARDAGVRNRCSSMFFPGSALVSPWPPFVGQMPVLVLEH